MNLQYLAVYIYVQNTVGLLNYCTEGALYVILLCPCKICKNCVILLGDQNSTIFGENQSCQGCNRNNLDRQNKVGRQEREGWSRLCPLSTPPEPCLSSGTGSKSLTWFILIVTGRVSAAIRFYFGLDKIKSVLSVGPVMVY